MNKSRGSLGLWAVLIKLGPKLLSVGMKVLKSTKVVKLGLAAGSVASYTVLYSWKFAVALVGMIFFHELGHLWAMKRCGLKTKGIYLIPFFGGAAVSAEAFPSRGAESFIAIAGPIFGLALSIAAAAVYAVTEVPFWAAVAGWWALINLFNLFPINPLDGGRILKSVAFSLHRGLGMSFLVLGLMAAIVFAFKFKMGLLVFISVVGTLELLMEWWAYRRELRKSTTGEALFDERGKTMPAMDWRGIALSIFGYLCVGAFLLAIVVVLKDIPGADLAHQVLTDR